MDGNSDDDGSDSGIVDSSEDSDDDSVGSCCSVIAPTISYSSTFTHGGPFSSLGEILPPLGESSRVSDV